MTTRIDNVYYLKPEQANLTIAASDAKRLLKKYKDDSNVLPEYCFLRDLEEKLGQQTKDKIKCQCGTQSYGNAKFCRECGTKIVRKGPADIEIESIDWHDDEYNSTAADTFFPVFVKEIVPCLQGHAAIGVTFGDDDIEWKTAHALIDNGTLTWCELQLVPGAEAPDFEADDLYEAGDEEDENEDEDEDEEEDNDLQVVRRR